MAAGFPHPTNDSAPNSIHQPIQDSPLFWIRCSKSMSSRNGVFIFLWFEPFMSDSEMQSSQKRLGSPKLFWEGRYQRLVQLKQC